MLVPSASKTSSKELIEGDVSPLST